MNDFKFDIPSAIKDFDQGSFDTQEESDKFFEKHGVGNSIFEPINPYERLTAYYKLLFELFTHDKEKYQRIHKGIPFYFLAWLAFDCHQYQKALFFIDAAVSEDIRATEKTRTKDDPYPWMRSPACEFLLLKPEKQVGLRAFWVLQDNFENELLRFNVFRIENIKQRLTKAFFVNNFIVPNFINDSALDRNKKKRTNRTIICAFYQFILEYKERRNDLRLRSIEGGSITPFVIHLFSGALIFESLLKQLFPKIDNGKTPKNIGDITNSNQFISKFGEINISAYTIQEIIDGVKDNSLKTSFSTTAKIRNTTGHNFVWDDNFNDPSNYELLADQIINAIFYLIVSSY